MGTNPTIACWANNLAYPARSLENWLVQLDRRLEQAHSAGAHMLFLPEYACAQWLNFAPQHLSGSEEIPWLASLAEQALPVLKSLAQTHDIALFAGTLPSVSAEHAPPLLNRAHLLLPDGRHIEQDKLCLTPDEKEADGWNLSPGHTLNLFEWQGWRVAIVICLDIELPALATRLAEYQPDLILVPSMTSRGGYWRVNSCAKARSVELFSSICVVGCYGQPRAGHWPYRGGASVYIPCEQALGLTGVYAELPPSDSDESDGQALLVRELPLSTVHELRGGGSVEVWPGAWRADHVHIEVVS